MDTTLASPNREQLETLGNGEYALSRYRFMLSEQISAKILTRMMIQPKPAIGELAWWRGHRDELAEQAKQRQIMLGSYRRLDRWRAIALGLSMLLGVAHIVVGVLSMTPQLSSLLPVGASALITGSACTAVLRYIRKDRSEVSKRLGEIDQHVRALLSTAQPMDLLPYLAGHSEQKFTAVASLYKGV